MLRNRGWGARLGAGLVSALLIAAGNAQAQVTLLNVSYDVTRELYKDMNPVFARHWQGKTGEALTINQSHGGSSKQALSVAAGLEADVVTMNQVTDIELLQSKGLVAPDWRKRLPHEAAPFTSASVFLVRKGNPKAIRDWADLARPGIGVIIPNPKTSGNGRYTYLAAWGSVLAGGGTPAQARELVAGILRNVPVLDGGGRGATTTFSQRGIGDVLVTFENEAILLDQELGGDQFDIVYPPVSVLAEAPVAVVDKVVDRRGTRRQATAYVEFLYSPEGQDIGARHYFRPRDEAVAKRHAQRFPPLRTFRVETVFGSWAKVQQEHFADGGIYDQLIVAAQKK